MDSDDAASSSDDGLRSVALEGHTRVEGQIDCIDVLPFPSAADRPPLIALASSRLEGSTWDGAISLLHAQGSATTSSSSITLTRAGAIRPVKYGVPALAWCGTGGKPMLAAARDDGDVEVYHLLPSPPKATGDAAPTPQTAQYELTPFTTLAEHDDLVLALATGRGEEANATMLATGSWDCSVRVWALGRPASSQRQFLAHVAPITALAWHPTSTSPAALLASASRDKSVKAWDLRSPKIGDCARLLDAMPHAALSLAWLPHPSGGEQVLALGLEDGGVALVDVRRPGILLAERRPHATRAGVVRFFTPSSASSSPVLLASAGDDGAVAVTPVVETAEEEEDGAAVVFGLGESRVRPRLHGDYARALGWLESTGDGDGDGDGGPPVLLTGGWDGEVRAVVGLASASAASASS